MIWCSQPRPASRSGDLGCQNLALEDRVSHDRRGDVGDDEKGLQRGGGRDAFGSAPGQSVCRSRTSLRQYLRDYGRPGCATGACAGARVGLDVMTKAQLLSPIS